MDDLPYLRRVDVGVLEKSDEPGPDGTDEVVGFGEDLRRVQRACRVL